MIGNYGLLTDLSHAQKRIWYSAQKYPNTALCILTYRIAFPCEIQFPLLIKAIENTLRLHSALNVEFVIDKSGLRQSFTDYKKHDIREPIILNSLSEEKEWIHKISTSGDNCDLSNYISVFPAEYADGSSGFLLRMHHLVSDGWTFQLLAEEIYVHYCSLIESGNFPDRKRNTYYASFIEEEQRYLTTERAEKNKQYWLDHLNDLPEPFDFPEYTSPKADRYETALSYEEKQLLERYCAENSCSLYSVFFSLLKVLILHWQNKERFIVGTTTHGRTSRSAKAAAGMFVNTMAYNICIDPNNSFSEIVKQTAADITSLLRNQKYPYDSLLEELRKKKEIHSDLLQIVFSYEENQCDINNQWQFYGYEQSPLVIHVNQRDGSGRILFEIDYQTEVFSEQEIAAIPKVMMNLFKSGLKAYNSPVSSLELLSSTELAAYKKKTDFNSGYPLNATIVSAFEAVAKMYPQKTAVLYEHESITYEELDRKSSAIALYLNKKGAAMGDTIAISLDRGIPMILAIIGVLKAGAVYLPIDPETPCRRAEYMLSDSNAVILIKSKKSQGFGNTMSVDIEDMYHLSQQPARTEPSQLSPENGAYIIYTSGTTGKPKGVLVSHQNIVRLLLHFDNPLGISCNDVWTMFHSFIFDPSVMEIFAPLLYGGRLVIVPKAVTTDPIACLDLLEAYKVTVFTQVPSSFYGVVNQDLLSGEAKCRSLRCVILGGEALTPAALIEWKKKYSHIRILNQYGPTETTIYVTLKQLGMDDLKANIVNIGKPEPSSIVYIMNTYRKVLPEAWSGELCISGLGVSLGYVNNEELTQDRFVQDPYFPEMRMYCSGDLVRRLPGGDIRFIQRIDNQIKIRGHRVEVGEIEAALHGFSEIQHAVVVPVKETTGTFSLHAVFIQNKEISIEGIRKLLSEKLPGYMVPGFFHDTEKFPRTQSGKIDRKALAKQCMHGQGQYEISGSSSYSSLTKKEKAVFSAWKSVLSASSIEKNDNFFHIGGDSIKAIMVCTALRESGYKCTVSDVFAAPVLTELSGKINSLAEGEVAVTVQETGTFRLSSIQKWFSSLRLNNPHYWAQEALFSFAEPIDPTDLQRVLQEIVDTQEALRTLYPLNTETGEVLYQQIMPEGTEMIVPWQEEDELASKINIAQGPVGGYKLYYQDGVQFLKLCIHHLCVDSVSWNILKVMIEKGLSAPNTSLKRSSVSFKGWTEKLYTTLESGVVDWQIEYWNKQLSEKGECVFFDKQVFGKSCTVFSEEIEISFDETASLAQKAQQIYGMSMEAVLLTLLSRALYQWGELDTIYIMKETHGREDVLDLDCGDTIGWFTSFYPLLLQYLHNPEENMISVKERLLMVPDKGFWYAPFVYLSKNNEVPSIMPEISFNFLGEIDASGNDNRMLDLQELRLTSACQNRQPYPFSINAWIHEGKLHTLFEIHAEGVPVNDPAVFPIAFKNELRTVLRFLQTKQERVTTPGDLFLPGLHREDWNAIKEQVEISSIERLGKLTPLEQGLLVQAVKHPDSKAYFELMEVILEGEIDVFEVTDAVVQLHRTHEALRSIFLSDHLTEPLRVVLRRVDPDVKEYDHSESASEEELWKQILENERKAPFLLARGPLFRVRIQKRREGCYGLLICFHHIILDGWSMFKIVDELLNRIVGSHKGYEPSPSLLVYEKWFSKQRYKNSEKYWREYLKGIGEASEIPGFYHGDTEYAPRQQEFRCSPELSGRTRELAKSFGTTLNIVMQTIWGLLIAKSTGTEEAVFGAVSTVRPPEVEGMDKIAGLCINILPVRVDADPEASVSSCIRTAAAEIRTEHQFYPLYKINSMFGKNVVKHVYGFENYDSETPLIGHEYIGNAGRAKVLSYTAFEQTEYSFNIEILPENELRIRFLYNKNIYPDEYVFLIAQRFISMLELSTQAPDRKLSELPCISTEEKKLLLEEFQGLKKPEYLEGENLTILSLFQEAVQRFPEKTAIVQGNTEISYRLLDRRANYLAGVLKQRITNKTKPVLVLADVSIYTVISILAVMKNGIPYLPIDREYPEARVKYILENSKAEAALCFKQDAHIFQNIDPVIMDDENTLGEVSSFTSNVKSNDPAYIIYTSGSTGHPKGVEISHNSFVNLLHFYRSEYRVSDTDRMTLAASPGFDAMALELWPGLTCGATLYITPSMVRLSPQDLQHWLGANAITITFQPSPITNRLLSLSWERENTQLRVLLTGGDELAEFPEHTLPFSLYNLYGPTETTVFSTSQLVRTDNRYTKKPSIGKPIHNHEIYVLDAYKNPVPIGTPGELYIGGAGLGVGYYHNTELTKQRFVENPFVEDKKLYRSGDLGRWLVNGTIEFLGRIDNQVKIRGNRVELGEIEHTLRTIPSIENALVMAKKDKHGNQYIAAYVTGVLNGSIQEIRNSLIAALPSYMVPSVIVPLEKFPVTKNGKIDRKALVDISGTGGPGVEYCSPRNECEECIIEVWEDVLGLNRIGIYENFFEIGGDSIKAVQVHAELSKKYRLSLNAIFEYETPESLALHMKKLNIEMVSAITRLRKKAHDFKDENQIYQAIGVKQREYNSRVSAAAPVFHTANYTNILITGATGFLGAYLTREVLKEFPKAKVHLIVREKNAETPIQRACSSFHNYFGENLTKKYAGRLYVYQGDIAKPDMGCREYDYLANTVDCIINSAALVKHYGKYEEFYAANVTAVSHILKFAEAGKQKDMYHISTTSVGTAHMKQKDDIVFFTEYDNAEENSDNHYVHTKITGEDLIRKKALEGKRYVIFRVGNIMFDSETGIFQQNIRENAFYTALQSYIKLKAFPNLKHKVFDISFVDKTAEAVTRLIANPLEKIQSCFHIVNPNTLSLYDLGSFLKRCGKEIETMEIEEFYDLLYAQSRNPEIYPYIQNLILHSHILDNPHMTGYLVKADYTNRLLSKLGFHWPAVERDHFKRMLAHCREVKFIN